jgi:hypothetical protein
MLLVIFLMTPFETQAEKRSDPDLEVALESIEPAEVYGFCKILSSGEFAGRLTGHEGYTGAARWAAERFAEWGLLPAGTDGGFLQPYPSPYTVVDEAAMTIVLPSDDEEESKEELELEAGKDFLPQFYTDSGDVEAGIVFAGWGISAPGLGYDDYAGIDVGGRFVLCFRGTPDREDDRYTEYDHHRKRMVTAKARGAVGLIYIYPEPIGSPNGDWIEGFLPAMISEAIADRLLEDRGVTAERLKEDLRTYKKPISFELGSAARYKVESRHYPDGIGYNVVGWIEGSDKELKDECIVLGAHLDHCGRHIGFTYYGAQDNASGSAVVMEIARAFSMLEQGPKRSVFIALFGGEEKGLEGSYHMVDNFPAIFEKIDAMFNFDMTGEGDGTNCGCTPEPPELGEMLREADGRVGTLKNVWPIKQVGVRSSDYAPFFLEGAACVSFFSNGPHLHYHLPEDTIYRINPDILADIAELGFLTAHGWADR